MKSNIILKSVILDDIMTELEQAEKVWPIWPTDPIHAASIVSEEAGELQRAANKLIYENGSIDDLEEEAIQTAAMAIRFLYNLETYKR